MDSERTPEEYCRTISGMTLPFCVPPELRTGPFLGSEAIRRRLITRDRLRGRSWRRIFRDVYVSNDLRDSMAVRLKAISLLLPAGAVVSGTSAAWLYQADIRRASEPLEVTLPRSVAKRPPDGVRIRRAEINKEDIGYCSDIPVTTPIRTAFDLARRVRPGGDPTEAVVAVDALAHLRLVTPERLIDYADSARFFRWRGVRQVAVVSALVEPLSESPCETRLRMRIVRAGLPRPEAQVNVFDLSGRHVARLDLAYRAQRIAVEYDGAVHEGRWREDTARRNRLVDLGWEYYGYTALDLRPGVRTVNEQLRRALLPR